MFDSPILFIDARIYLRFFFFNDPATTAIYTLSLHDALPIFPHLGGGRPARPLRLAPDLDGSAPAKAFAADAHRSEEHTSELQSRRDLVCRLLLEKKKTNFTSPTSLLP